MSRKEVFKAIGAERDYQDSKWGPVFDDLNTPNDWVAYISRYLGLAVIYPFDRGAFHTAILKVATLCVAVLERQDYAPRHYDDTQGRI